MRGAARIASSHALPTRCGRRTPACVSRARPGAGWRGPACRAHPLDVGEAGARQSLQALFVLGAQVRALELGTLPLAEREQRQRDVADHHHRQEQAAGGLEQQVDRVRPADLVEVEQVPRRKGDADHVGDAGGSAHRRRPCRPRPRSAGAPVRPPCARTRIGPNASRRCRRATAACPRPAARRSTTNSSRKPTRNGANTTASQPGADALGQRRLQAERTAHDAGEQRDQLRRDGRQQHRGDRQRDLLLRPRRAVLHRLSELVLVEVREVERTGPTATPTPATRSAQHDQPAPPRQRANGGCAATATPRPGSAPRTRSSRTAGTPAGRRGWRGCPCRRWSPARPPVAARRRRSSRPAPAAWAAAAAATERCSSTAISAPSARSTPDTQSTGAAPGDVVLGQRILHRLGGCRELGAFVVGGVVALEVAGEGASDQPGNELDEGSVVHSRRVWRRHRTAGSRWPRSRRATRVSRRWRVRAAVRRVAGRRARRRRRRRPCAVLSIAAASSAASKPSA
jgi:hypothetical protein